MKTDSDSNGVIAINRNILANFIASNCNLADFSYAPSVESDTIYLETPTGMQTPSPTASGNHVIEWNHQGYDDGYQEFGQDMFKRFFRVFTKVTVNTSLDVYFEERSIRLVQSSLVNVTCALASNDTIDSANQTSVNIVNKTLTNIYSMSVSQNGALQLVKADEKSDDQSESIPASGGNVDINDPASLIRALFNNLVGGEVIKRLEKAREDIDRAGDGLHELPLSNLQNLVFPSGRVFTYKDPFFSDYQDLVCKITYLDPSKVSTEQPATQPQEPQEPVENHTAAENPPPPTGTVGKLIASTELMQNYIQGEIISPTGKFEAVQTSDGHGLLFAIDTTGVFHVIEEQSGTLHIGWQAHDLSSAAIQTHFPGRVSDAMVRTFDVGQSAVDGTIGMMMAISLDGQDHLFMSLRNSNEHTSWASHPAWTRVPFDAANEHQSPKVTVTGALFAETQDKTRYLVVDIERPLGNKGDAHISRYYIDSARRTGHYWIKHDVTIDISATEYQSVVGRLTGEHVDGIYTAGSTGGKAQLVYEPIINYYGKGPVVPTRFRLPGGVVPSAVATARNPDGTTDLYAVGGTTLYRLAPDEGSEDAEPTALCTSNYLSGTDTLRAMTHDGVTTIWGRNMSDQVYYSSCAVDRLAHPRAWSPAIPILSGIERISAYVNRVDGRNTIFASGNGKIQKITQGSAAVGKVWRAQEIAIAQDMAHVQDPLSFMSYTTTIQVSEIDRELPVPNSLVNLSAISRTPVYINGLYYVLSATPIQVATDHTGSLTIVEATENLHAAVLTVSLDNTAITVNAMDNTFLKLTALDTAEKLRGARVPSQIVAGGTVGSPETEPVIGSSVSDDDADAVAANMALLQRAYAKIREQETGEVASAGPAVSSRAQGTGPAVNLQSMKVRPVNFGVLGDIGKLGDDAIHGRFGNLPDDVGDIVKDGADEARSLAGDFGKALESFGDVISESAGNVLQWVKHGGEVIGRIVYDTVTKTVHFIAKVGKQIYHAVLDTVHAIVAVAEWVYQKIKTVIETIIKFLQMLFEWDDIRRTKDVMLKLTKLWLQGQVDNLPKARQELDKAVSEVEKKMNEWANITDWSGGLSDGPVKGPISGSGADISQTLTSGSRFLVDKYKDHAHQLEIVGDMPAMDLLESLLVELLTAISKEAQTLDAVFTQLQNLVSEFHSLSVEEILKRLVAIIVDGTLSSLQFVLDAVLNILFEISQTALSVLDTKIRIPVISWILKKIGVPELSFLDLFSWIGGFAVTVIYKATEGEPPFPKGDSAVADIESASGWGEIPALFSKQHAPLGASVSSSAIPSFAARHEGSVPIALSAQKPVFVSCHLFSAALAFVGSPITALETEDVEGSSKILAASSAILGIAVQATKFAGDFLVNMDSLESLPFVILSGISTTVGILVKIMFSGPFQKLFTKVEGKLQGQWPKFSFGKMLIKNYRGVGAFLSAFLCIYHLPPTIWHFYELSKKPNDLTKAASITAEVSALAADISTIAYAFAVNDDEEESRQVAIGITVAANSLYVALQVAEVGLGTGEL